MNSYNYDPNDKNKFFKNLGLKALAFVLAVFTFVVIAL